LCDGFSIFIVVHSPARSDLSDVLILSPDKSIYNSRDISVYGGWNMSKRFMRMVWAGAALFLLMFQAGCAVRSINRVMADPHRYANREVGIKGEVIESWSVVGRGAYRVDDGTGQLWIVTDKGVPRKGARIVVHGKIKDGYDLGSLGALIKLPEKFASGMVMIESKHKAQF
jgi:hypothetical protein